MDSGKGPSGPGSRNNAPAPGTPADVGTALAQASALHQRGLLAEAQAIYRDILRAAPDHFDALYLFGLAQAQSGRLAEAEISIRQALKINPRSAAAHSDMGNVLSGLERHADAIESFNEAIALKPDHTGAFLNRGNAFVRLGRHAEALASYERAIAIDPGLADAHANRGVALLGLGRFDAALASFDQVILFKPFNFMALGYRAETLRLLKRHEEAIAACDRALALKPDLAGTWLCRGKSLQALKRGEEALASYRKSLALQPASAEAWLGCGLVAFELKRFGEAVEAYDKALALDEPAYARGLRLHAKLHTCDWRGLDAERAQMLSLLREGQRVTLPFALLAIPATPSDRLKCAQLFAEQLAPAGVEQPWRGENCSHDKIRIAYVSSDFHEHATAHLVVGLFEHHDKSRFETTALTFGPTRDGEMHRRIRRSFDHFIDAGSWTDRQIVERLRAMEIDIAVDLKGHAEDARTGLFALRAAPVQVNYLGFPGTIGAGFIDYILADRIVIPEDQQQFYAERVATLPDSYQINDSIRRIADRAPSRAEAGLPEHGFVFCSFNNNYKITPAIFDVWMRLLRQVDDSVLWLLEGNPLAPQNLRREAELRGVSPDRLIFAPHLKQDEHLARHRLADLFLDTAPCNAHTTASDALWAGLPIVTLLDSTFPGRVCASLLHAIGLPELVTSSPEEYEALALKLAREPVLLASLREKLANHRDSHPLFDTARTTRQIEAAFATMWERHRAGELPASFSVPLA